jgi:transglutaminase-like putative cysteine protease
MSTETLASTEGTSHVLAPSMKLQVTHRTRYDYASPVRESYNEVRLKPVTNAHQICESFLLKVLPAVRLSHYTDFHANWIHIFDIPNPHPSLQIESLSRVVTTSIAIPNDAMPAPLAKVTECQRMERCFDFLQESTHIERSPEVWRHALDVTAGQTDMWQAAQAIMRHVHSEFTYTPNVTTVHTHARDVLLDKRGVCQDLAHVMIAMCRALGIPALYVSGYLYNGPRDQLIGTQASHAWCEVFLPGIGWRGLDPTNAQQVDERYIKLAVGSDYADVPPVRGLYKGTTERKMEVEVHIEAIE